MKEKILIIDDEAEIRGVLMEVLQEEGYEVIEACDGKEGLERFHKEKPDLVITDVKMPKKDGLAVLKGVKESGSDTDVIILTGHSDEATAVVCLRTGAYDYLFKPLEDLDVLFIAIHRALEKRKLAIQNILLLKQLEELAIRDPLTGLYNARQMQICLDNEIERSKRYGHAFGVLIMDIDHFKNINDTYGHLFGDHVLKKLGTIMQKNFRTTDQTFRYGGEEFLAIMSETDQDETVIVVDRFMDSVRNHTFISDEQSAKITISIGAAFFPFQSTDKLKLIKLADRSLYQAKAAGRDRVVFCDTLNGGHLT